MPDFKSNPGSFLPLMESSRRGFVSWASAGASPITLLEILAHQSNESMPLFDLQAKGGMHPARYGAALKSLLDAGYIEIVGDAPEQVVHLNTRGAEVVKLARPA